MKKQARTAVESKSKKLQLHKETLQKLVSGSSGGGGTVTLYTCPDNTTGNCFAGACAG